VWVSERGGAEGGSAFSADLNSWRGEKTGKIWRGLAQSFDQPQRRCFNAFRIA
jgi:hypothetical protein